MASVTGEFPSSYLHISSILGCLQSLACCKGTSTGKPIYPPNIGVSSVNFPNPNQIWDFSQTLSRTLRSLGHSPWIPGPKAKDESAATPARAVSAVSAGPASCRPRQLPRCRGRSPSFPARCCQRKAGSGELETSAIRHG